MRRPSFPKVVMGGILALSLAGFMTAASQVGTAELQAVDGAHIWAGNPSSNTVTKLRASDGATVGTFVAGVSPKGVAFDGANVWVANYWSNTVSKR